MRRGRSFSKPARGFARVIALGSAVLLSSAAPSLAQGAPQDKEPDDWWFQVTPYFLVAGVNGGVTTGEFTAPIDESLGQLSFAAHGEFGKGRVLGGIDFLTMKAGADSIPLAAPELGTSGDYRFTVVQMEFFGAYRFGGFDRATRLDLLGGIRYNFQDQDLVIRATPIDKFRGFKEAWVDFFAGARFGADLGRRWYIAARADAGGGGAKFTANATAGIGFRIITWLDVNFGFRYLFINYADGVPGSPAFYAYNADQYGVLLGFGVRF